MMEIEWINSFTYALEEKEKCFLRQSNDLLTKEKRIRRKQKRQQDEGERKQQKDMYATSGKTVNRTEH